MYVKYIQEDSMSDTRKIAEEVIWALGGRENITSVSHCATRLRVMVKRKEDIDQKKAESIDKVKGAFFHSGQYQLIFGTGTVNRIYEEVIALGVTGSAKDEQKEAAAKSGNLFQRSVRAFGDVFVPIIPILVATGLFMGIRGLILQEQVLAFFGMTPEQIPQNVITFSEVLTDTAFAFLPALVAWSAFRVFGGNPVIGMVLGLMLVSPALPNAYDVAADKAEALTFFGFIPVLGYQGSVLPAFIAGLIGAKLERSIRKHTRESLDLILTPFLTLLFMIILSLFIIGPVFHTVEEFILNSTVAILNWPFGISGLIIGSLNQLIVVTGVHHVFNLLEIQLLERFGYNQYNAIITCSVVAQGGAALAVGLKTKSKKLKAIALPSSFSALLGITEPAIFGVNLRYIKPFVMALIGGGIGGFAASLAGLKATGMAITAIPGVLLYLNGQIIMYLAVNFLAVATAFVLTWLFGFSDKMIDLDDEKE